MCNLLASGFLVWLRGHMANLFFIFHQFGNIVGNPCGFIPNMLSTNLHLLRKVGASANVDDKAAVSASASFFIESSLC